MVLTSHRFAPYDPSMRLPWGLSDGAVFQPNAAGYGDLFQLWQ
jgi:hypothetical protein